MDVQITDICIYFCIIKKYISSYTKAFICCLDHGQRKLVFLHSKHAITFFSLVIWIFNFSTPQVLLFYFVISDTFVFSMHIVDFMKLHQNSPTRLDSILVHV